MHATRRFSAGDSSISVSVMTGGVVLVLGGLRPQYTALKHHQHKSLTENIFEETPHTADKFEEGLYETKPYINPPMEGHAQAWLT